MYSKILVCMSLDHGYGKQACEVARKLLSEGGKIMAVHVIEPPNDTVRLYLPEDHFDGVKDAAAAEMEKRIGNSEDVEKVLLTDHSPGRAITALAKKSGVDCIIVGSYKPNMQDYFLGSTTSRIVRHAPCPVHVLR